MGKYLCPHMIRFTPPAIALTLVFLARHEWGGRKNLDLHPLGSWKFWTQLSGQLEVVSAAKNVGPDEKGQLPALKLQMVVICNEAFCEHADMPYSRFGRPNAPNSGMKAYFERSWNEYLIMKISRLAWARGRVHYLFEPLDLQPIGTQEYGCQTLLLRKASSGYLAKLAKLFKIWIRHWQMSMKYFPWRLKRWKIKESVLRYVLFHI